MVFLMKKLLVVLVAAGVFVLPSVAEAGTKTKVFVVGDSAIRWETPEKFKRTDTLVITFSWGRFMFDSTDDEKCVNYFTGHGMTARVATCGHNKPMRIKLVSARNRPATVKLRYEKL